MDRTWTVEIEGKKHLIELDYAVALSVDDTTGSVTQHKDGKVVVDRNEVCTWGLEPPKEISFEIGGKPAILRKKKGFFATRLELFFEGQLIKPS